MPNTRITEGLSMTLPRLENIIMFVQRLERQPEFKDSDVSKLDIKNLENALEYSERLIKQLYQRAAAYPLKKESL